MICAWRLARPPRPIPLQVWYSSKRHMAWFYGWQGRSSPKHPQLGSQGRFLFLRTKELWQTTDGLLECVVQECGTWGYAKLLVEALGSQHVALTINVTQRFESWCGNESELRHFSAENLQERAGRREEECSRFAVQRERRSLIPILSMIVARSGMYYLPSFSTEVAALENVVLKEMATESWNFVFVVRRGSGRTCSNCAVIRGCWVVCSIFFHMISVLEDEQHEMRCLRCWRMTFVSAGAVQWVRASCYRKQNKSGEL